MKDFFELNRVIKLRIIMMFLGIFSYSTAGASMAIYYNQNMGSAVTGILLIIGSIVSFLTGIFSGHQADLRGRRPIMLIGGIVSILGASLAAFANSPAFFDPWLTFFGFLIFSFGSGLSGTAAEAMLVDITDSENRKIVYSLGYWVINLAIAFGSAISGWFFRDYLFELLLFILICTVINLLIVVLWIPESFDPKRLNDHQRNSLLQAYRRVSKDKIFMIYLISLIFMSIFYAQFEYALPVHLSNTFKSIRFFGFQIYGQRMLTIMLLINTVLIVLFLSTVRKVTNHWSNKKGVLIGALCTGIGFAIALFSQIFVLEIIAILLETIGEMILVPFSQALTAEMMNPNQAGAYSGMVTITGPVAAFLTGLSVSGTAFYGDIGLGLIILFVTGGVLITAFPAITMHEKKKQGT
ncbi:MDR family MFS transporter [Lactococcus fujiensis]|uniref:Membrane protein n=1 Tax=Lactococcus fujiensis JCM 16395 TaxID=1291764 RepID=A0A2A5RKI7_9LACT|nr:MFS transporter [Lactococcus fujiensis]PCR99686.1 membrane protein [Lactococcus fujiensis JCM 16395]